MAKTKTHLFSEIRGSTKNDMTIRTRNRDGLIYLGKKNTHSYTRTEKQDRVRKAYAQLKRIWKKAEWINKTPYEILAIENHISPWNAFIMHHMPIMSKSPILYLPMIEGTGTTTHDLTHYGNDGTIHGATWQTNKKGLNYLYFDGTDDYIEVEDNKSLDIQEQTIIIFMKHIYTSNWQCYFNHKFSGVWLGTKGGTDNIQLLVGDGSKWILVNSYNINWNGNNMIAAKIYSDANNTYGDIYLNATKLQSKSATKFSINYANKPIRIGNQLYQNAYPSSGNIYFVALYNRALSDEEIKQIYTSLMKFYTLMKI